MANESSKLMKASAAHRAAGGPIGGGAGPEIPASKDSELLNKWHDRSYNPVDDAERAVVSEKLNGDAGRYRKGPGPL
jgi:hypothetical protein